MMVWARGYDRLRHVLRAAGLYETKTMIHFSISKLALCQTCHMCKDACILCLDAPSQRQMRWLGAKTNEPIISNGLRAMGWPASLLAKLLAFTIHKFLHPVGELAT